MTSTTTATHVTGRQLQVLRLIERGLSNVEVAAELGISPRTAKAHCDAMRFKLGVDRRRRLPARARELGLLA